MIRAARPNEATSRPSVADGIKAALLIANLGWTTLALGGYRPETKVVTLLLTAAALLVHCGQRAIGGGSEPRDRTAAWFLPFVGYAALNVVTVSPVRWLGWLDWLGWANAIVVFWITTATVRANGFFRSVFFVTLSGLGLIGVAMGCYQRFANPTWLMLGRTQAEQFIGRASGPFGIPNSFAAFLVLLLPAAGALAFRARATSIQRVWWGWVTAVLALGLLLTVSRGAWIALGIALVGWPLAARTWTWKRRAMAAVFVIAALTVTSAVWYQSAPMARERFGRLLHDSGELSRPILWRVGWSLFAEHPWLGTGAGSYNLLFERHRPKGFIDEPQWAHNDYLNTLSDYGIVGAGLFFGAAMLVIVRGFARSRDPVENGNAFASPAFLSGLRVGLLAFAFQLGVDFHLKIPATAMAAAVVAALTMRGAKTATVPRDAAPRSWLRAGWALAGLLVLAALFPLGRFVQGEALRYRARQALDRLAAADAAQRRAVLPPIRRDLERATTLAPAHAGAWSDLAFALEFETLDDPSLIPRHAEQARAAAERAVGLSAVVPEFWIRLGVALDLQGQRTEAASAYEKAVSLAPRSSHAWYYYAHHLSSDTDQRDAALRAIATCLSLDPGNAAAEALRVKLNDRTSGALLVP